MSAPTPMELVGRTVEMQGILYVVRIVTVFGDLYGLRPGQKGRPFYLAHIDSAGRDYKLAESQEDSGK